MAKIDIHNPAVQEACFYFLRFHVGIGSREEHEAFAREVLLAATEFMFQTGEPTKGYPRRGGPARPKFSPQPGSKIGLPKNCATDRVY